MELSKAGKLSQKIKAGMYAAAACVAVLGMIAIDTTVVEIGSDNDFRQQAFSPDQYGQSEFPRIQGLVENRAVDAVELASALSENKDGAVENHATVAGAFPVFPVKFTGVAGEQKSGVFEISVDGLPEDLQIRVQSGPAINGTELRDIAGDIEFGEFKNQIEYQNAGAGINRAMSAAILADLNREELTGQTVSVVGAFTMINPKSWLITPVEFEVQ